VRAPSTRAYSGWSRYVYLCGGRTQCPLGLSTKGTTGQTVVLPSGTIPGHGGDGVLHVAFAIGKDELDRWETHLTSRGVAIEGRNDWERGGRSLYFRDPDGHLLETGDAGIVVDLLGTRASRAICQAIMACLYLWPTSELRATARPSTR
jgi:hypothetical protein